MKAEKLLFFAVIFGVLLGLGCAQVQVKAPKEPIKVDITMRLDIYQHVKKDIDDIESIVSGETKPKKMKLNFIFTNAYAEEGLGPEVEQAALRRRDRLSELNSWQEKGAIGENRMGLVEARKSGAPSGLITSENSDRMIIYQAIAKKNEAPLDEVQKLYAFKLQENAPSGTPIEVLTASGSYEWKIK